jgi:hypothetical protein
MSHYNKSEYNGDVDGEATKFFLTFPFVSTVEDNNHLMNSVVTNSSSLPFGQFGVGDTANTGHFAKCSQRANKFITI